MEFLNNNPGLYSLLVSITSHKGDLRVSFNSESIKYLINLKYGLKENFKSIVEEFIEAKTKEIHDRNIVKIYRLYVDNQPGPVFLDLERAMAFIGLKKDSSMNESRLRIEPILVTREQSAELFGLSTELFSPFKKLVDEIREVIHLNKRKRRKELKKEILDFSDSLKEESNA